jgi:hypothetical protein
MLHINRVIRAELDTLNTDTRRLLSLIGTGTSIKIVGVKYFYVLKLYIERR